MHGEESLPKGVWLADCSLGLVGGCAWLDDDSEGTGGVSFFSFSSIRFSSGLPLFDSSPSLVFSGAGEGSGITGWCEKRYISIKTSEMRDRGDISWWL